MDYRVSDIAAEFMVNPNDLEEIYNLFFKEADAILEQALQAIKRSDASSLAVLAHDLKGSAANLRMTVIAEQSRLLEQAAKSANYPAAAEIYPELRYLLEIYKQEISSFYQKTKDLD